MQLVLISGLSGSGKSVALNLLEDSGYYCVDNLPVVMLTVLIGMLKEEGIQKTAIAIDARSGHGIDLLPSKMQKLAESGIDLTFLFLHSTEDTLLKRYSESRRRHPLAPNETPAQGIEREIENQRMGLPSGVRFKCNSIVDEEIAKAGAPARPSLGYLVVGFSAHAGEEIRERFLPGMINGSERWCQGFSEPGAGSDLASLTTTGLNTDILGWQIQACGVSNVDTSLARKLVTGVDVGGVARLGTNISSQSPPLTPSEINPGVDTVFYNGGTTNFTLTDVTNTKLRLAVTS